MKSNSANSKERSVSLSTGLFRVALSEQRCTERVAWPSRNSLRGKFHGKMVSSYH